MRRTALLCLAIIVAGVAPMCADAQKKKTPPKKPAATQKKPTKPPVLGTKQMSGDQAVLGTEYTLGKENPMNIKVTRVEYRADRIRTGDTFYEPDKAHKVLVVYFTWHNPVPRDMYVRFDTFRFLVVDASGANHDGIQGVFRPETNEALAITLKPGQKVDGLTLIPMPAKGDIEKMMIQTADNLVLRYALTGKIKPLDPAYADPDDKTGFTAREDLVAKIGVPFQLPQMDPETTDMFDVTIDSVTPSSGSLSDEEQPEETTNLVVAMRTKNASLTGGKLFRFDSLHALVTMDDGSSVEFTGRMLHATAKRDVDFTLEKGAEVKFRIWFQIPKDAKPTAMVIRGRNEQMRRWVLAL